MMGGSCKRCYDGKTKVMCYKRDRKKERDREKTDSQTGHSSGSGRVILYIIR